MGGGPWGTCITNRSSIAPPAPGSSRSGEDAADGADRAGEATRAGEGPLGGEVRSGNKFLSVAAVGGASSAYISQN